MKHTASDFKVLFLFFIDFEKSLFSIFYTHFKWLYCSCFPQETSWREHRHWRCRGERSSGTMCFAYFICTGHMQSPCDDSDLASLHNPGFPDRSVGRESACNAGDPGLIPGLGRSAGEGIGYPLLYSWASLVAQLAKNPSAMQETWVRSLGWKIPWRRERFPTPVFWPGEFHGL